MWEKVRKYIDLYLNQTHIQSLTIFQSLLEQTNQIEFLPEKLTIYKSDNSLIKKTSSELQNGLNKFHCISITILRSINSNNFTFLLAAQKLPTFQLSKYIFVVVIWPKQPQIVTRWKDQLSLNMWITIRQPYKYERQDKTCYLIVRLENIVIEQGKRWKDKSQNIKQKANQLFKNKKFQEALTMYQFALCNSHDHVKSYERAILYCNSAACLYEMKLFSSSILYCNLAIKANPTYPKAYSRKLNSLLQLSEYSQIPPCLLKLQSLIPVKQFQFYNQKFTTYLSNDIGIYNWLQIFDRKNNQKFGGFGEYHSCKIEIRKSEDDYYVARQDIAPFELILVNKPILYFKIGQNINEGPQIILEQVKKNCLLQKSFYETMKLCPPITNKTASQNKQNSIYHHNNFQESFSPLFRHPVEYQFPHTTKQQTLSDNELRTKIQTSLFMERFLQSFYETIGYGLWRDLFYFPLDCEGNCTYIHINNALVVFATNQIKKGEALTIDFLSEAQALSRTEIMQNKYQRNCQCIYCSLCLWPQDYNGDIQGLYELIDELPNIKTKKQMIRQIIFKKAQNEIQSEVFDSLFPGIIYRYLLFVEKDPHWQDILLLMRILRDQEDPELSNKLLTSLMSCFNKYLKLPYPEVKGFVEQII